MSNCGLRGGVVICFWRGTFLCVFLVNILKSVLNCPQVCVKLANELVKCSTFNLQLLGKR